MLYDFPFRWHRSRTIDPRYKVETQSSIISDTWNPFKIYTSDALHIRTICFVGRCGLDVSDLFTFIRDLHHGSVIKIGARRDIRRSIRPEEMAFFPILSDSLEIETDLSSPVKIGHENEISREPQFRGNCREIEKFFESSGAASLYVHNFVMVISVVLNNFLRYLCVPSFAL